MELRVNAIRNIIINYYIFLWLVYNQLISTYHVFEDEIQGFQQFLHFLSKFYVCYLQVVFFLEMSNIHNDIMYRDGKIQINNK